MITQINVNNPRLSQPMLVILTYLVLGGLVIGYTRNIFPVGYLTYFVIQFVWLTAEPTWKVVSRAMVRQSTFIQLECLTM